MKVALNSGSQASPEELVALENLLQAPLPTDYARFLELHDGAKPTPNTFTYSDNRSNGVTRFIPAREIPAECAKIDGLPKSAIPIADLHGGNYLILDMTGAVWHWDHELEDSLEAVAGRFGDLLESLRPFDPASVQVDPTECVVSYSHPDLEKFLRGEVDLKDWVRKQRG